MVTKKEIITENEAKIKALGEKLDALRLAHEGFKDEDAKAEMWEKEYDAIRGQIVKLLNGQYAGNFGDEDSWYYSRIPPVVRASCVGFSDDIIKEALNDLRLAKLREIEASAEYHELSDESDEVWNNKCEAISREHQVIQEQISTIESDIAHYKKIIIFAESSSWLRQHGKNLARQKEYADERALHQTMVKDCLKKIKEVQR